MFQWRPDVDRFMCEMVFGSVRACGASRSREHSLRARCGCRVLVGSRAAVWAMSTACTQLTRSGRLSTKCFGLHVSKRSDGDLQ
jgi:hypothetical protein